MYTNLRNAIKEHEAKTLEKFNTEVETKTASALLKSWYYRELMTPKTVETVKGLNPDAIPDAETLKKIKAKKAREESKRTALRLAKIEAAENASESLYIDVSVEFNKSRVWGWNPSATVRTSTTITKDTASGCGYDKESAAIAGAMNENPVIMKILYDHAENGGAFPYSVHTFAGVPAFDGGCGVSCFYNVFKACGYEWRQVASGEHYNAYTMVKTEK